MKITENALIKLGFKVHKEREMEVYQLHDIQVWNWNDEHWIVDALDQAGIDAEFKTIGQLQDFFSACSLNMRSEEG